MNTAPSLEDRLMNLELKFSDNDDLLDTLNRLLVQQQQTLERLQHEVAQLRRQQAQSTSTPFNSLRDELPPHY
jgi:SlyX protein